MVSRTCGFSVDDDDSNDDMPSRKSAIKVTRGLSAAGWSTAAKRDAHWGKIFTPCRLISQPLPSGRLENIMLGEILDATRR